MNKEIKDLLGGNVACINGVCAGDTLERIICGRIGDIVGRLSFLHRLKRFSKRAPRRDGCGVKSVEQLGKSHQPFR